MIIKGFFPYIYKVYTHKCNYTKFYAIHLKNIVAIYRNKGHPIRL